MNITGGWAFGAVLCAVGSCGAFQARIGHFNSAGKVSTLFDVEGEAVDAHDGDLAFFEGRYWLYGTSYDCGFQWQVVGRPFCGFKSYSSPDLVHWKDEGFLFDARGPVWQERCDGKSYGCYRPHVLHNASTGKYVLWVNVYDNRTGYRVFTADKPGGPFTEQAETVVAVNSSAPVKGLNNGDHDLFLDEDGKAYLAYTDWRTGGSIIVERLDAAFLKGTGEHVKAVTPGTTEAPVMFRRGNLYYMAYSDPNCGYCATGTSYRTATNPLGPWSAGKKISDRSCGGQPSFLGVLPAAGGGSHYLYGVDLWNNAAKNEALAGFYWTPLRFGGDGSIGNLPCEDTVAVDLGGGSPGAPAAGPADRDQSAGIGGFTWHCDVKVGIRRSQAFTATRSGTLTGVSFTTFQDGFPASELILEVYGTDGEGKPSGAALSSHSLAAASLGWSPRRAWAAPGIKVEAGKRYALVMRSATSQGCYGMAYRDAADGAPPAGAVAGYTSDGGATWRIEAGRTLKFETRIAAPTAIAERMAKMRARAMAVRTGGSVDAKGARGEGGVRFRAVTAE